MEGTPAVKCNHCGAPFSWARGCIVHVEGCPGVEIDEDVFGVGVAYIEPE